MFEDYKKSLLDFYRIKKENHRLSINLEDPGREKIRNECVKVFLKKNTQKDKDFIKSVFDPDNQSNDLIRSIEKFDLNRFRALVSFLTQTQKDRNIRDENLVKLLAWLIDFPSYDEWRELSEEELKFIFEEAAKKPEDEEIAEPIISKPTSDIKVSDNVSTTQPPQIVIVGEPTGGSNGEDVIRTEQPKGPEFVPRFYPRYITISCIVLLFIGTTSFAVWERRTKIRMPEPEEKFMYWDEDHYEPVKGGKQNAGAPIIPLNKRTLTQQQKITLPDTLTSYSIGKVWYKGHGKDHEFFTDSGAYPQDLQRVLKPLSYTILTKYTSNYRYMLTRLVWFICAAFFISLCGFAVSRLEKEVKPPVKEIETETEKEEIPEFHSSELQATSA